MPVLALAFALVLSLPALAAAQDEVPSAAELPPSRVTHAPLTEVSAGTALVSLTVEDAGRIGTLVVLWQNDDGEVHEAEVLRTERGWQARLEGVVAPRLRYWIVRRGESGEEMIFADAETPHAVRVTESLYARHQRTSIARVGGHLSQIAIFFEWVGFGHRRLEDATNVADEYWHGSVSYAYSFYDVVERIRVELGSFRGRAATASARDALPGCSDTEGCEREVGLDYGLAELSFFFTDGLRLRAHVRFGFSQTGFDAGGGGAIVIGEPDSLDLTLGFDGITTLGITALLRMGFWAHPIVPMGVRIEATNFPAGQDFGVRLLYDLGIVMWPGALARAYVGYQSRTAVNGFVAAGGEVVFAF